MLLRLLVFIGVLLPDFLHMFYRYATSRRIHRSIRYGFHGRSLLDVSALVVPGCARPSAHTRARADRYIPEDVASRPAKGWPVVIFFAGGLARCRLAPTPSCAETQCHVAGGAWIIGHRAWAALMGWQMCQKGVLFVSPDYR